MSIIVYTRNIPYYETSMLMSGKYPPEKVMKRVLFFYKILLNKLSEILVGKVTH